MYERDLGFNISCWICCFSAFHGEVFDVNPFTVAIDRVTLLKSSLTFAVVCVVLLKWNLILFFILKIVLSRTLAGFSLNINLKLSLIMIWFELGDRKNPMCDTENKTSRPDPQLILIISFIHFTLCIGAKSNCITCVSNLLPSFSACVSLACRCTEFPGEYPF